MLPATRDFIPADLRPRDILIISPSQRVARTPAALEGSACWVFAVDRAEHFPELARWAGEGREVDVAEPEATLPSGATVYMLLEETVCELVQVREPNGMPADIAVFQLTPLEGRHVGALLWLANGTFLLPLPRPDRCKPTPHTEAARLLAHGDRLREIGLRDLAASTYRQLARTWPFAIEGLFARKRLGR